MAEVEAKRDRVKRHALRHDRHIASLLTDYIVFLPMCVGELRKRQKRLLGKLAKKGNRKIKYGT